MANLSYIRNFCFSHSSKDELSYCLSTFEAAVEYINLGKLQDSVSVTPSPRKRTRVVCFSAAVSVNAAWPCFPASVPSGLR